MIDAFLKFFIGFCFLVAIGCLGFAVASMPQRMQEQFLWVMGGSALIMLCLMTGNALKQLYRDLNE